MEDRRLIIAVDYGTTYTGVAYAHSTDPQNIGVVKSWPGGMGAALDKIPSVLSYNLTAPSSSQGSQQSSGEITRQPDSHPPHQASPKACLFGMQIKDGENRLKCLKLLLDEDQLRPNFVSSQEIDQQLSDHNGSIVDATADFLAQVCSHAKVEINKTNRDEVFTNSTVRFMVTVPAMPSDKAKNNTLKAAKQAGIGPTIELLSEPEAAAVHLSSSAFHGATNSFERFAKRGFTGDEAEVFEIPLKGVANNADLGIEDMTLRVTGQQMKALFDPSVAEVIKLIGTQFDSVLARQETVSVIVLAGGFGQSAYLYNRIHQHFVTNDAPASSSSINKSGVSILHPIDAWTAVVRGAVMRGLGGTVVTQRRARRHYGTEYDPPYDLSRHSPTTRFYDPVDGIERVRDEMFWLIKKNDVITDSTWFKIELRKDFRRGEVRIFDYNIYETEKVCTLEIDFGDVPSDAVRKVNKDMQGRRKESINFEVGLKIESDRLHFAFFLGGEPFKSVHAKFDA
ncbi:MAG: hypothetical protein M1831_004196 [Alyxoria varia]|nr:MAG: hypothetical protein M1831_004196 [Alyxoria varia]